MGASDTIVHFIYTTVKRTLNKVWKVIGQQMFLAFKPKTIGVNTYGNIVLIEIVDYLPHAWMRERVASSDGGRYKSIGAKVVNNPFIVFPHQFLNIPTPISFIIVACCTRIVAMYALLKATISKFEQYIIHYPWLRYCLGISLTSRQHIFFLESFSIRLCSRRSGEFDTLLSVFGNNLVGYLPF